ncbi:MAG: GGDEF domain-containing protein [Spirochaetaceae bacterium]|jgi:diguanylate cyclase (GGDEF)-like protein|nr:GGDEF domain-containing protein [Spirochaetaceae bacterium]
MISKEMAAFTVSILFCILIGLFRLIIKQHTRNIDIASRFGGDEFVILLSGVPGTDVASDARATLTKLKEHLLTAVNKSGKRVTFSIGAITFHNPPGDLPELIKKADAAMYQGKKNGKDQIIHEIY